MEKKHFLVTVNAPRKKVWKVLWDDDTYRKWTAAFTEGSHAKTDGWKEGSTVHFLDPNGEGMYSKVDRHVPERLMSFEHIGMVKNGKEMPLDDETRKWAGAKETYILDERDGAVELRVELDVSAEHASMFDDSFPKALQKVKELAEAGN